MEPINLVIVWCVGTISLILTIGF